MTTGLASGIADGILDAICKDTAFTAPAAFYVQLHTGDPGSAGTANVAGESTRKQATFGSAASGSSTTTADVAWTAVSTTETYSHVSFWSAVTAGTFVGSDALSASKSVDAGDDFTIPAGDLTLSLSPIAA